MRDLCIKLPVLHWSVLGMALQRASAWCLGEVVAQSKAPSPSHSLNKNSDFQELWRQDTISLLDTIVWSWLYKSANILLLTGNTVEPSKGCILRPVNLSFVEMSSLGGNFLHGMSQKGLSFVGRFDLFQSPITEVSPFILLLWLKSCHQKSAL